MRSSWFLQGTQVFRFFLVLLVFIFSTNFLQSTPIERIYFEIQAFFLLFIIIFSVVYLMWSFQIKQKVNKHLLYFSFVIIFAIFYSAWRSHDTFGQPYIYGILAQRKWIMIGVGFLLYYWLKECKISFEVLENVFVTMAWISLVGFTFLYIYFSSHPPYINETIHFISSGERGLRLHFNNYFITFGAIYYFIKNEIKINKRNLIYLILFLFYTLLINKGRTFILYLGIVYLLFSHFRFSLEMEVIKLMKIFFLIIILVIVIQLISPDYVEKMRFSFMQMFEMLKGKTLEDSSLNARFFQISVVFNFFVSHPEAIFLGVGQLSHQWNGGFDGIFGYFYPSDIGLIGILFLYGVVGFLVVYVLPVIMSMKLMLHINDKRENNCFILTLKYMLFLVIISSVTTGNVAISPYVYVIPFFILYAYGAKFRRYNAPEI